MTKPTPLEELLLKLEGKLPEELLENVSDFLYEQEEAIKEFKLEIEGLEEEVGDLEEQVEQEKDKEADPLEYDVVAQWLNYEATHKEKEDILQEFDIIAFLRLPHTLDKMQDLLIPKLEEYINQHGVEDTLDRLTQDHSQEVEHLHNTIEALKEELEEAQHEASEATWVANSYSHE